MFSMSNRSSILAGVALLGLAGCAGSTTPPASLVSARQTYQTASNDPRVAANAQVELQTASAALQTAEDRWAKNRGDTEEIDHLSYVADRRAQIAQQTARLKDAQQQVTQGQQGRATTLLEARTAQVEQLQQQIENLRNQNAQGPTVLTLGDVVFEVNKAELKPGAFGDIRQIAEYLKQHPERSAAIAGYTDSSGGNAYNLQLSQARAEAVKNALIQEGVKADQISARGFGEDSPVATNTTPAGRQLNRRVEITIGS